MDRAHEVALTAARAFAEAEASKNAFGIVVPPQTPEQVQQLFGEAVMGVYLAAYARAAKHIPPAEPDALPIPPPRSPTAPAGGAAALASEIINEKWRRAVAESRVITLTTVEVGSTTLEIGDIRVVLNASECLALKAMAAMASARALSAQSAASVEGHRRAAGGSPL